MSSRKPFICYLFYILTQAFYREETVANKTANALFAKGGNEKK